MPIAFAKSKILSLIHLLANKVPARQKAVFFGVLFLLFWEYLAKSPSLKTQTLLLYTVLATFFLLASVFWVRRHRVSEIFSKYFFQTFDYLVVPVLLLWSTTAFIALNISQPLEQAIIGLSSFFLIIALSTLNIDKRGSLVAYNIFIVTTFFTAWLAFWVSFALGLYTSIPTQAYVFIIGLTSLLLFHQLFHFLAKGEEKSVLGLPSFSFWIYALTFTAVILEAATALTFWPALPYVLALVLLLVFYLLWEITWHYFLGKLTKKIILEYAIIIGVIALVLVRAIRWFPTV